MGNVNIDKVRRYIQEHPESISSLKSAREGMTWTEYFPNEERFVLVGLQQIIEKAREEGLQVPQDYTIFVTPPKEGRSLSEYGKGYRL